MDTLSCPGISIVLALSLNLGMTELVIVAFVSWLMLFRLPSVMRSLKGKGGPPSAFT